MFKKKKIPSNIVLYTSAHNKKKSMELKAGMEMLNLEYEQLDTQEKMPYMTFNDKRENFSQAKAIVYEHVRIQGKKINRGKRRWMKKQGVSIIQKRSTWWQRIKKAWRQS